MPDDTIGAKSQGDAGPAAPPPEAASSPPPPTVVTARLCCHGLTATFDNRRCQMLHVMLEGVQHGSVCVVTLAELLERRGRSGPEAPDGIHVARTTAGGWPGVILGSGGD